MEPYQIIFEDSEIIVVNKSSGIPTQPDKNNTPSLLELLTQERPNLYLLHRLDQRVSGLVIFAKTELSAKQLNKDFQTRNITKKYRAIVANKTTENEAKLTHWLFNLLNGIIYLKLSYLRVDFIKFVHNFPQSEFRFWET